MFNYIILASLTLTLISFVARGHKHMMLPLLAIFLIFGNRFYHREHERFLTAVKHGELSKVQYYLKWYADPNYLYGDLTPLLLASQEGHKEVVQFLLAHGADKQATNKYGATATPLAAKNNHKEIVELLTRQNI